MSLCVQNIIVSERYIYGINELVCMNLKYLPTKLFHRFEDLNVKLFEISVYFIINIFLLSAEKLTVLLVVVWNVTVRDESHSSHKKLTPKGTSAASELHNHFFFRNLQLLFFWKSFMSFILGKASLFIYGTENPANKLKNTEVQGA